MMKMKFATLVELLKISSPEFVVKRMKSVSRHQKINAYTL